MACALGVLIPSYLGMGFYCNHISLLYLQLMNTLLHVVVIIILLVVNTRQVVSITTIIVVVVIVIFRCALIKNHRKKAQNQIIDSTMNE